MILGEKCFHEFLQLIHELSGVTIESSRVSLVEGRLRKRLTALGLRGPEGYEDYLGRVREDTTERDLFIDLMTTHETYFFRTPRIWEYIENQMLPAWCSAHPKKEFTAWSAASSSGEEAHSLGMLCQALREKNPNFRYNIWGTDISQEMVALCQKGSYSGRSIESFKKHRPDFFKKYMNSTDQYSFQVNPKIRERIRFSQHNLFDNFQNKPRFDLILIRNVLIYFNSEDQEKVIELMSARLSEDGLLIIGESESLSHITTKFKPIEPLIYQPKLGKVDALRTG
jgi:chemotaxis protein methyltransferase CheR